MSKAKLGMVAVSIVAGLMLSMAFAEQAKKPPAKEVEHKEHDSGMQACAKACSDCQRECDVCSTHCAHMLLDGKKEHVKTLMTCQDCADVCAAASQIVARGGPFSGTICGACADVCADCAKQCEMFADDEHMKKCAEECRRCEKACRAMAKHSPHAEHAK